MINHEYKDRLFSFIFGREENKHWTLSLYNAINHSNYTNPDDIQITTMDDVLYMSMKNDVSFILDNIMTIYEQQSTFNPNMPLRGLMYAGRLYSKYIREHDYNLYGSRLIPLPVPKLVTFYNGKLDKNDMLLELRDAFQSNHPTKEVQADIAVQVRMININYGKNKELMEACQPLKEYAWLVAEIRSNSEKMAIEEAVKQALEEMPETFSIKNLLMNNRAEVTQMCITEYDEAKTMALFREEGKKEGLAEGKREGLVEGKREGLAEGKLEALVNIIKALDLSIDKAMDAIGIASNEREKYAALVKAAMQP